MQENFLRKLIKSKNDPYAPRIENLIKYMEATLHENFLIKLYGDMFYDDDMCDIQWMAENRIIAVMDKIYNERKELVYEPFGPLPSCNSYYDVIQNEVEKEGDQLLLLYCLLKRSVELFFL